MIFEVYSSYKDIIFMNTTALEVYINEVDMPIFQALFDKFKIKTKVLKKDAPKKLPIEKALPNEETHQAFMEVKEKGHLLKRYKNARELFEDIDNED